MTENDISKLLDELTIDIDAVDKKIKKVKFPVDENDFGDENFLKLYSCSKQYRILKKICSNIIKTIPSLSIKHKRFYLVQFENLEQNIPSFDFEDLEICPEAENLKFKYIKYLKQEKINTNTL